MSSRPSHHVVHDYLLEEQTDLFFFSGPINRLNVDQFIDGVLEDAPVMAKVSLYLTTWGGDADAAYRLIRTLLRLYQRVRLLLAGPCKSAGTLIAVGAHELRFARHGELGPLDVQVTKPDELMPLSSGLDIFQALSIVNGQAFQSFEQYFLKILGSGSGNISTRTASDIATKLVVGLYTPLSAQLDPLRLGEVQRAISVAKAYGERLGLTNLKPGALDKLIEQYPSHGFVIDMQEAQDLFQEVKRFSSGEQAIYSRFDNIVRYPRVEAPFSWNVGSWVAEELAKEKQNGRSPEEAGRSTADPQAAGSPSDGAAAPDGPHDDASAAATDTAPRTPVAASGNGGGTHPTQVPS
jgi:hypothetical protein